MITSSSSMEKFLKKVINPYFTAVMKHPQTIEMHEGVLHIHDVQGPKKEGSEKARLAIVEQEIFKCQVLMESGLCANHSMITDWIHKNKKGNDEIVEMIFKLHDRLQDLQALIFCLQNQNYEYDSRLKRMSIAANFSIP
ncbi:40s ribosomal protein s5-1 [Hordeum vulgare]|nr:40s ribosomal protein s5-1 [Hordeum vulgare]